MGLPAQVPGRIARGAGHARESRLRLVRPSAKPPRAASARAEAACKSLFNLTLLALVALAAFGLARVTLSAKVAEAAIDATKVRKTIKAESLVASQLEMDKSTLVTPSRIESIAASALKMEKAAPLRYLSLPATPTAVPASAGSSPGDDEGGHGSRPAESSMGKLVRAAMDVTEKEARALLVGDVGLSNVE